MPAEVQDEKPAKISMRHSKLKASEAALLAGELKKPNWQSKNEGIHERVSFEDAIWGFDLAGGSFYKTPLRVTAVKPDSRAEKAGIRPGDNLLRINDIDTSTLTIQEAHEIIIESGIHLRLAVTAPDDEEDSYHCWQDPTEAGYDSEEERRREEEKIQKRIVHAKVSSYWSLQWPWVSKRKVIYRESNCFMVPSKFESRHRDKFPLSTFGPKVLDDIVLQNTITSRGEHHRGATDKKTIDKVKQMFENTRDTTKPKEEPVAKKLANGDNSEDKKVNDEMDENVQNALTEESIEKEDKKEIEKYKETEEARVVEKYNKKGDIENSQSEDISSAESESISQIDDETKDILENGQNNEENKLATDDEISATAQDEILNQVLSTGDEKNKGDDDLILSDIISNNETQNSESMSETNR